MKRILCAAACLLIAGCATVPQDTVYQVSTIDALLAGVYDGELTLAELTKHGDFGIGTFNGLDGEMILLDGCMYQVRADGKVYRPSSAATTPFAAVCRLAPETTLSVADGTDYKALEALVDNQAPNKNLFCAIRITGTFSHMKTRSVPSQKKPYPPLAEVTKNQPEFEMTDISGTIVGFRCPPFVKGVNVPGYHLHFISSDRKRGGHILGFEIDNAICEIDVLNHFYLQLPTETDAFGKTDLTQDRAAELESVEK